MAWDINRVVLVGRLTKDVELLESKSGSAFAKASIAVGGKDENATSFFDIVLFGKTAENTAKYAGKGSQICVEGSLNQSRWEQDGQKRSRVEIMVDRVQFLGVKKSDENGIPGHGKETYGNLDKPRGTNRQESDFDYESF